MSKRKITLLILSFMFAIILIGIILNDLGLMYGWTMFWYILWIVIKVIEIIASVFIKVASDSLLD